MHSIKYLSGILILHFIYITITTSHVGRYKANTAYISHVLQQITTGGGGQGYLPTTEKRTVIRIITKTKL